MQDEVQRFLETEEAVRSLLSKLEELQTEVSHYSAAGRSLDEVRRDLQALIERTSALSEEAHASVAAVKSIGTPELVNRLDTVVGICQECVGAAQAAAERVDQLRQRVDVLTVLAVVGVIVAAIAVVQQFM